MRELGHRALAGAGFLAQQTGPECLLQGRQRVGNARKLRGKAHRRRETQDAGGADQALGAVAAAGQARKYQQRVRPRRGQRRLQIAEHIHGDLFE